jgi:hypothetical protein
LIYTSNCIVEFLALDYNDDTTVEKLVLMALIAMSWNLIVEENGPKIEIKKTEV